MYETVIVLGTRNTHLFDEILTEVYFLNITIFSMQGMYFSSTWGKLLIFRI
jgi:hypothetical protein